MDDKEIMQEFDDKCKMFDKFCTPLGKKLKIKKWLIDVLIEREKKLLEVLNNMQKNTDDEAFWYGKIGYTIQKKSEKRIAELEKAKEAL